MLQHNCRNLPMRAGLGNLCSLVYLLSFCLVFRLLRLWCWSMGLFRNICMKELGSWLLLYSIRCQSGKKMLITLGQSSMIKSKIWYLTPLAPIYHWTPSNKWTIKPIPNNNPSIKCPQIPTYPNPVVCYKPSPWTQCLQTGDSNVQASVLSSFWICICKLYC